MEDYNIQSFNGRLIIKQFTSSDLVNNCLILTDAFPGDVVVINNNGLVIYADQEEYTNGNESGVKINLSSYNVQGTWKVRYNKSNNINALIQFGNPSNMDNIILYSLIFS